MTENLISIPYTERNAEPGFGYAGGFQDILTAYNGLNHRGADVRYANNQSLLNEQIIYLEQLRDQLRKDEDDFFSLFGINGNNYKERFTLLKNKIEAWDATGADCLVNESGPGNKFYKALEIFRKQAVFDEIPPDEWEYVLDEAFKADAGQTAKKWLEEGREFNIADLLNEMVGTEKKRHPFSSSAKSSLVGNLVVSLEDGELKITSNSDNISPSLKLKVVSLLKKRFGIKLPTKTNYNFKKMFNELFSELNIDTTGQKYIRLAIGEQWEWIGSYAFSSNTSQIKGFLGEIYNNALLYFMADGSPRRKEAIDRITPTGAILNENDKQIVIDTWLQGYGIQVKNYEKRKTLREGFTFSERYDAFTFITHILQLPTGVGRSNTASVGDILLNFFAAYDYNQDYGKIDESVKNRDSYKYWKMARARMNDKIRDEQAFTNIVMPYVTKLIGIDKRFYSKKSNLFIEQPEAYRNSFFNISGKYIPSSVLVQAIIDTINKKQNSLFTDIMTVRTRFSSHTLSDSEKWNPSITNKDVDNIYKNRKIYAEASRVRYSINIDIDKIANELLQQI